MSKEPTPLEALTAKLIADIREAKLDYWATVKALQVAKVAAYNDHIKEHQGPAGPNHDIIEA